MTFPERVRLQKIIDRQAARIHEMEQREEAATEALQTAIDRVAEANAEVEAMRAELRQERRRTD